MPNTNHQIIMRVNPAKVTLHLDNLPGKNFDWGDNKYAIMLERETPVSTFLGHEISRTLQGMERSEGRDWQDVDMNMVGYYDSFLGIKSEVNRFGSFFYRPAEFPGVPVGNYRIRVYFGLAAMAMKYPMLVFEKHFEVKPSDRDIQLRTEYQGPIDLQ